jgi:hypothetical protein
LTQKHRLSFPYIYFLEKPSRDVLWGWAIGASAIWGLGKIGAVGLHPKFWRITKLLIIYHIMRSLWLHPTQI